MAKPESSKKPPAFLMYASDWLGSTKVDLMSLEQQGAYFRLLCHQWGDQETCSIPADDRSLSRLSRLGSRWEEEKAEILECFEPHPDLSGRLTNRRLYSMWVERQEFVAQKREAGKKSGEARSQRNPQREGNGNPNETGTDVQREPQRNPQREGNLPSPSPSPISNSISDSISTESEQPAEQAAAAVPTSSSADTSRASPAVRDPVVVDYDPDKCLEILDSHEWLAKILDPHATLHRLHSAFPHLDLASELYQAAVKLTPERVRKARGRGPEAYLAAWLKNSDRDRVADERRADTPEANGPDKLRAAVRAAIL